MIVLAHRGWCGAGGAAENTIAAFEAAAHAGVDGFETDVRLDRHGEPILHHDERLPDGAAVAELARPEIAARRGRPVAALAEALDRFPRFVWDLEIKAPAATAAVLEALDQRPATRARSLVTSFDPAVVRAVAEAAGPACGLLLAAPPASVDALADAWAPWPAMGTLVWAARIADAERLRGAHEAGFRCAVYDVASEADHRACRRLPLWAVITDDPRAARLAAAPPSSDAGIG